MKSQWNYSFVKYTVFLLVSLISIFLFMHSSFFYIDQITVQGAERMGSAEVIRLSGLQTGLNIFSVNGQQISQALKVHPMVQDVKVIRHWPRHLEIQVSERQAWALIPCQGGFLCIDQEGVVIDKLNIFSPDQYCIITMDKQPEQVVLGQVIDPEAIAAIRQIWEAIPVEPRVDISDYHYVNESKEVILYTNHGTEILFGDLERLADKVQSLLQIINIEKDYEKQGKSPLSYVDLRFKGQPVVKTLD
ncbi:MAG TPA: hypothetical protein DER60_13370 [Syntrophomonas sp.]|jgi:cell division protein FtsQ|nr:hypothetical protein [Syntrophomonas sp.]